MLTPNESVPADIIREPILQGKDRNGFNIPRRGKTYMAWLFSCTGLTSLCPRTGRKTILLSLTC